MFKKRQDLIVILCVFYKHGSNVMLYTGVIYRYTIGHSMNTVIQICMYDNNFIM